MKPDTRSPRVTTPLAPPLCPHPPRSSPLHPHCSNLPLLRRLPDPPISDLGAEIWWNGQKGYATKLETVRNSALRKVLGAFRTTPTAALQTEAALPPVHVRLHHAQRRYTIRILTMSKDHPIRRQCPVTFPPNHWYELDLYLFIYLLIIQRGARGLWPV